jgi:hypothetical protein
VLSLHHIHCLGGAHAQAESTGRAQILAMTRRWSPRVATGVGSQKTGVDPSAGLCGRRTEGAQVQAYRRLDTLPAGRMSRGHFYSSTMLKRCSPLGAPMRALPRLRSPTGTRQTRQCLRYAFRRRLPLRALAWAVRGSLCRHDQIVIVTRRYEPEPAALDEFVKRALSHDGREAAMRAELKEGVRGLFYH